MGDCEELSLELSIGGKYAGKSENLVEKVRDFCVQNANSESGDLCVSRCDFSETFDLQRRREIQASRRQEARRKREEKVRRSRGVGFVDDKLYLEAQKSQGRVRDRKIRENEFNFEGESRGNGGGEAADELRLSLFSEKKERLYPKVQLVEAKNDSENSDGGKSFEQCSDFHRMSQKGGNNSDAGSQSSPSRARHVDKIDGRDWPSQAAETDRKLVPTSNPEPTTWMRSPESSSSPASQSGSEAQKAGPRLPEMPCVSATGEGPNGRTVIGFLYKYDKREVSIICVCHGSSFSPAEFVEHAGSGDVSHPLRHITVVTS